MIILWALIFFISLMLWERLGLIAAFAAYAAVNLIIFEILLFITNNY